MVVAMAGKGAWLETLIASGSLRSPHIALAGAVGLKLGNTERFSGTGWLHETRKATRLETL